MKVYIISMALGFSVVFVFMCISSIATSMYEIRQELTVQNDLHRESIQLRRESCMKN